MLPIAVLLAFALAFFTVTRFAPTDRRILRLAYFGHILGVVGIYWMNATRGGDMEGYDLHGKTLVNLMYLDIGRWGPEVLRLVVHQAPAIPIPQYYDEVPAATRAMDGLSALVYFVIGGPSLFGACLFVGTLSFVGKALVFRVVRDTIPKGEESLAAYGLLLVPSAVFWTCGLMKEAFAVSGMGFVVFGVHAMLARRRLLFGLVPTLFGALLVGSVKGYILFPLVLSVGAWVFAARSRGRLSPFWVMAGLGIAFAGVIVMGKLFPEFALDKVGETLSHQRSSSELAGGGAYVGDLGADEQYAVVDTSLTGQLRFLPLAVVNALFRPFLFEVRSVPQLAAALENTTLIVIVVTLVFRFRIRGVARMAMSSPFLLSALVFTIVFGTSVGLANQNLGTLSRYRVPMMPAYVTSILLLRKRLRGGEKASVPLVGARRVATGPKKSPGEAALARAVARRRAASAGLRSSG